MNKNPLQIYVLWHKEYKDGIDLASYLFKKINRDPDKIDFIDIGIPVHFRNMLDNEPDIQYNSAEKTAIIILIDDNMVIDIQWNEYITNILKDIKSMDNVVVYPVAINNNSFNFNSELQEKNFIRMMDIEEWEIMFNGAEHLKDNVEFKKEFILNQLAHEFACELYNTNKGLECIRPLKIFLSHTKRDEIGIKVAKMLKLYIETFSKSKTFFDSNDIQIGQDFWQKIDTSIKDAFLVVIRSDKYTSSSWCRREILSAKKHNRPIISIDVIAKEEIRSFPYMGNIRTLRLTKLSFVEFYHIITEIYREALRQKYNELKLKNFIANKNIKAKNIIRQPELLNFHNENIDNENIDNENIDNENIVIYPDPPLSEEELELLDKDKRYFTPLTYCTHNVKLLENKKIGFSISESSQEQKNLKFYSLKDVMCELIRYILYLGGNIYYGGNLKYCEKGNFNLLKAMTDVIDIYVKVNENSINNRICNYVAYPLTEKISVSDKSKYKRLINFVECIPKGYSKGLSNTELNDMINIKSFEHMKKWAVSLTEMRENLIDKIDMIIIMGGKINNYKGKYPGVLEEFLIATKHKKPIYLLGGFGGAAKEIINMINGEDSKIFNEKVQIKYNNKFYKKFYDEDINLKYHDICEGIKKNAYSQLNNGLSNNDNDVLFKSEDSQEIIELILKGISTL